MKNNKTDQRTKLGTAPQSRQEKRNKEKQQDKGKANNEGKIRKMSAHTHTYSVAHICRHSISLLTLFSSGALIPLDT